MRRTLCGSVCGHGADGLGIAISAAAGAAPAAGGRAPGSLPRAAAPSRRGRWGPSAEARGRCLLRGSEVGAASAFIREDSEELVREYPAGRRVADHPKGASIKSNGVDMSRGFTSPQSLPPASPDSETLQFQFTLFHSQPLSFERAFRRSKQSYARFVLLCLIEVVRVNSLYIPCHIFPQ